MTVLHHLNCGWLHAPPNPRASCHCLLLEEGNRLALVDTGIGLLDVQDPDTRIGRPLIELAGFQFNAADTAVRQIERLGLDPRDVADILLTHADPDHTGGLADFPQARVHVSAEEHASLTRGHFRYLTAHFAHGPKWSVHGPTHERALGLEARRVDLGFSADVFLVPLFGHTRGHCGVAIRQGDSWVFHVGDAYYLRVELERDDHPVSELAAMRADDNGARIASMAELRRLWREPNVELFGYHDVGEFSSIGSSRMA